jgi:hypothetical protein
VIASHRGDVVRIRPGGGDRDSDVSATSENNLVNSATLNLPGRSALRFQPAAYLELSSSVIRRA